MSVAPDRGAVVFTKRDLAADPTDYVLTADRFKSWPRFRTRPEDLDVMLSAVTAASHPED